MLLMSGGGSNGFSEPSMAPRVLATSWGKVTERKDANPCKEDGSQKVVGSDPSAGKGSFLMKSLSLT